MFKDLSINLAASVLYDFSKKVLGKETVQVVLRKLGNIKNLSNFPDRYVETLVELRLENKPNEVLNFFRHEDIMEILYNFYYAPENSGVRNNERVFFTALDKKIDSLKIGDDLKSIKLDIDTEIQHFRDIFKQKIHESRTVSEAELLEIINELRKTTNSNAEILEQIKQKGIENVINLNGEKIYNFDKIDNATFNIIVNEVQKLLPKILTTLPPLTEFFIGRDDDMQRLHEWLFDSKNEKLILLVNGEGGMGKTTFAGQYCHRYQADYQHIAWVLSQNSIEDALLMLEIPLKLTIEGMDRKQRLQQLIAKMQNLKKPCLLVIDNANEFEDLTDAYPLLRSCSNFHLLITTRIDNFAAAKQFPIESLPLHKATELFKDFYPQFDNNDARLFEKIYTAVGGNTLVIELLAKNLAALNLYDVQYTLQQLWNDIEQQKLLNLQKSENIQTDHWTQTQLNNKKTEDIINALYDLSKLSNEEKHLLALITLLPTESIEYHVLKQLVGQTNNFAETFKKLNQKGWLTFNANNKQLKFSPVVQQITTNKNPLTADDAQLLISNLNEQLIYEGSFHTHHTIESAALYARYAESVFFALRSKPNYSLSVLSERIATYYKAAGDFDKALHFFNLLIELIKELYEANPKSENIKNGLAISYHRLGAISEAKGDDKTGKEQFAEWKRIISYLAENFPQVSKYKGWNKVEY